MWVFRYSQHSSQATGKKVETVISIHADDGVD